MLFSFKSLSPMLWWRTEPLKYWDCAMSHTGRALRKPGAYWVDEAGSGCSSFGVGHCLADIAGTI